MPSAGGDTGFPIQSLPYGAFDDGRGARMGVAIGAMVLDVSAIDHGLDPVLFAEPALRHHAAADDRHSCFGRAKIDHKDWIKEQR